MKGKKYSLFLILLLAFVFFNSCSWWEKQRVASLTDISSDSCTLGSAPFVVGQIEKADNDPVVGLDYGDEGLARTFSLNLKACMRDSNRQDTPIQNTPFVIEYYRSAEDRKNKKLSKASAVSNFQGCIQWNEEYSYKYTVNPVWIGLERTIKKETGAYSGAETIPLAINPWLSDEDQKNDPTIIDIRCDYFRNHKVLKNSESYKSDGLKYLSKIEEREKPLLWAPTVSLQINEVKPDDQGQVNEINNSLKNTKYKELCRGSENPGECYAIRQLLGSYQKICGKDSSADCYQRELKMTIYIPLQLRTKNRRNNLQEDDLQGGTYDIETELIISPEENRKNYRLHKEVCKNKISFNETIESFTKTIKSLSFNCNLKFSYFHQNAKYQLAIRIQPSSSDFPFKKFEGIYNINLDFHNERKSFDIDSNYDESYAAVLGTANELEIIERMDIQSIPYGQLEEGNFQEEDSEEKPVFLEEGELAPISIPSFYSLHLDGYGEYKLSHVEGGSFKCSEKENVVERTVVFVGKLCLTDVLSSQSLSKTPFRVFLEKPKENTITEVYYSEEEGKKRFFGTDGRRCISVPIPLRHKLYNRQKYFHVDMHILSEDLNLYGKVRLALSPWQRAFQAFQDAENISEEFIRFNVDQVSKPQLVINQFRSINLFPSYGLDKLLNIHLFHRIYLLFQPFIRRPDNLALGLDYKSRELLRDGRYLVRVLVLRNPQETTDSHTEWARAQNIDELNSNRANKVSNEFISLDGLKEARYVTHTDSVVKAKANFINFYMPLYLSTKQFYYIASRNFLMIEIHPADPAGFKYKQRSSEKEPCVIDERETDWRPFIDHDLENSPYVGAINIQNWVNWNLLQPAKLEGFSTDDIIEQSEIGRKYKHFNLSSSKLNQGNIQSAFVETNKNHMQPVPVVENCVDEVQGEIELKEAQRIVYQHDGLDERGGAVPENERKVLKSESMGLLDPKENQGLEERIRGDVESCSQDNMASNRTISPGIEGYVKKEEESIKSIDVLKEFSEKQNLQLINLFDSGNRFIQDIQESFEKYRNSIINYDNKLINPLVISVSTVHAYNPLFLNGNGSIFNFVKNSIKSNTELLNKLPEEDVKLLEFRMNKICRDIICINDVLKAYLDNVLDYEQIKNHNFSLNFAVQIINERQLLSPTNRELFNKSLDCETAESCFNSTKPYLLGVLETIDKLSFYEQNLLLENLMLFLSKNHKQELFTQIDDQCDFWFSSNPEKEKKCYYKIFQSFYEQMEFSKESHFSSSIKQITQSLINEKILQSLNESEGTKDHPALTFIMDRPTKESLFDLIQTGIKEENKHSTDVLSFTKPLCFFWFDHYLKSYLSQKEKLGAYANHISRFDYNQILDQGYVHGNFERVLSAYPSIIRYFKEEDNEKSVRCYDEYANCLLADHCQERTVNDTKEKICSIVKDFSDKTCNQVLQKECQSENSSLSFCKHECLLNPSAPQCEKEESCNKRVRNFCLVNGDHKLCEKYNNRCVDQYFPCLTENNAFDLDLNQTLNYDREGLNFEPLKTCLKNPYDFFQFENKMVIYELAKRNHKYKGGFLQSFNVAANFSIGSYMNWTAQRGRSVSVGTGLSLGNADRTSVNPGRLNPFSLTLAKMDLSQSISSNESNSGRRAVDNRAGESVYLSIGKAVFDVGVTKYQKCLVIKPRPNSFMEKPEEGKLEGYKKVWSESATEIQKIVISRPGLVLCNPVEQKEEKEPEYIEESYYYISQAMDVGNSQFLNLYDLANRPFVLVLRGRKEFVKYYHLTKLVIDGDNGKIDENGGLNKPPENMFIDYPFPVEEAVGLSLTIREFNETGFSPGIYHYPDDSDKSLDVWFANHNKRSNFFMELLGKYNLFSVPSHMEHAVPNQER